MILAAWRRLAGLSVMLEWPVTPMFRRPSVQAVAEGRHPIVAIKNAKVGDYNGRTLSTTSSSSVTLDPDIPEAGHLRQW